MSETTVERLVDVRTTPRPFLSREEGEILGRRSLEMMVNGSLADFEAVCHPNAVNREAAAEPPETRGTGPAAFYATALWLRGMFADLAFEVHELVIDEDLIVIHNTMSGRHAGPAVFYGPAGRVQQAMPPTGKTFTTTQTHWLRVLDGLVIEHWANRDDQGTAMQLGWLPPSPVYLVRMALATRRARRQGARTDK